MVSILDRLAQEEKQLKNGAFMNFEGKILEVENFCGQPNTEWTGQEDQPQTTEAMK